MTMTNQMAEGCAALIRELEEASAERDKALDSARTAERDAQEWGRVSSVHYRKWVEAANRRDASRFLAAGWRRMAEEKLADAIAWSLTWGDAARERDMWRRRAVRAEAEINRLMNEATDRKSVV